MLKLISSSAISLGVIAGQPALAATVSATLFADQTLDSILYSSDKNNDGDANDPGETAVFFGVGNGSGIAAPTNNVFTLKQGTDGSVYIGDGGSDTVYRLRDLNGNNDAMDAGEATVWFSADNAEGNPLLTPNGISVGPDDAIYIVEADTLGMPNGDFVYRTEDLNGDGDANDEGESSVWLDLKALNPSSSPFEIEFDGSVAYIIDSVGPDTDVIYRAEDADGSGVIEADEVVEFIDGDNPFGAPLDFGLSVNNGTVYVNELVGGFDVATLSFLPNSVYALTDLDSSGMIDAVGEAVEVWDGSFVPAGLAQAASFSVFADDSGLFVTSNGSDANEDNIFRLIDLNNDGDFFDSGETTAWLSFFESGSAPVRARAVTGYAPVAPIPLPATGFLLMSALIAPILWRRRLLG